MKTIINFLNKTCETVASGMIPVVEAILKQHAGQENAITTKKLAELIAGTPLTASEHQNYGRNIREAIEVINHNGGLICSDTSHGYWWGAHLAEDLDAVEAHIKRARHQLANASLLKANLQRTLGGQTHFE